MAKKKAITRIDSIYSETKDYLSKYYERELSTTKPTRKVVWEKDGYNMMIDRKEDEISR